MADINNDPSMLYDEEFMRKREEMFKNASADADISSGRDKEDLFEEEQQDVFDDSSSDGSKGGFFSRFRRKKKRDDDDDDDGYDIFDLGEIPEREKKPAEVKKEKEPSKKKEAKVSKKKKNKTKEDYISVSQPEEETVLKEATPKAEPIPEEVLETVEETKTETEKVSASAAQETVQSETDEEVKKIDDINALLESVGITPVIVDDSETSQPKDEISFGTRRIDESDIKAATGKADDESKTRHFSIGKNAEKESSQTEALPKKEENPSGSGQIMLDGYADENTPVEENETDVEKRLKTTRKNLIDNFRVLAKDTDDSAILERQSSETFNPSITDSVKIHDGEDLFDAVEKVGKKKNSPFQRFADKSSIKAFQQRTKKDRQKEQFISASALSKELKNKRNKTKKNVKILLVLSAVLVILSFLTAAYTPDGALQFLFGNGARVFTAINLVLLAGCVAVSFSRFKEAFETVKEFQADGNACLVITVLFVILQLVIALITGMYEETGILVYAPFAAFACLVSEYNEYLYLTKLSQSVSLMMRSGQLVGVESISNKADAAALAHGISDNGEPLIYYSADTSFPENLMSSSKSKTSDDKFFGVCGIAVIVFGIVFGVIMSVVNKSASLFAICFAGFVCLCMPNLRNIVLTKLSEKTNASLSSYGATVVSFDDCDEIGKANAVVIDAGDIFVSSVSKFRVVPGSRMAQSDAVVYAASTLKKTKSLLANCFDDFLEESGIKLPEAEDVKYEDRLGYSSWVAGRRVLVGNREMLIQHSISCPSKEEEDRYSKGRSVMYVAVEGIIAATFIVTFSVRGEVRKSVSGFNATGLVLMLNSADAWLNEDNASSKLGADKATIKITSTKGSEIIASYKNNPPHKDDCGLICSKKQKNVLPLVNAAHNLFSAEKLALLIYTVGTVLSFVFLLLFAILKASVSFTAVTCIVLQVLWAAASYYVGLTRIK